jgi:hypothetical protein
MSEKNKKTDYFGTEPALPILCQNLLILSSYGNRPKHDLKALKGAKF